MFFQNIQDIYISCYKKSFLFAKSYVHDEMVAEDIVSDSIIKLWQLMKEKDIETPERFLVSIIRNKALDYLRHKAVVTSVKHDIEQQYQRELDLRVSSLEACNPDDIFSSEIVTIINNTIGKLPEQTRIIFKLSRFDNLSQKEIAEKTGLSVKSIEYHISKSLKLFRIELADYLPFFLFF